jgi:hypothetical protein
MAEKMPPVVGRKFGDVSDYENLRVDGEDLYWNGKKLRTVGLSIGEKIQIITLVGAILSSIFGGGYFVLINFDKFKPVLCSIFGKYCPDGPPILQKSNSPRTN